MMFSQLDAFTTVTSLGSAMCASIKVTVLRSTESVVQCQGYLCGTGFVCT